MFRNDGVRRRRPIHPERLPENYEPSKNRFVVRSISLRMGHKIASHRCSHIHASAMETRQTFTSIHPHALVRMKPSLQAACRASLDSSQTTLHEMSLTPSSTLATRPVSQYTLAAEQTSTANEKHGERQDEALEPLGWLEHACLNLSPSFFSLNMGTGIASILLYNLPFNADWLRYIAIAIFILNIVLFVLLCTGTIVRLIRWKGIFAALSRHTLAGMYWGCLPMGMITIIVSNQVCPRPCADTRT